MSDITYHIHILFLQSPMIYLFIVVNLYGDLHMISYFVLRYTKLKNSNLRDSYYIFFT